MTVEKTLLTCSIPEFMAQIMVVKSIVTEWLGETQFVERLRYTPEYAEGMSDDEKKAVRRKAFAEHLDDAMASALQEHPQITARLICALCFIDEADIGNYRPVDLFAPIKAMLADEELRNFFLSFLKSQQAG